MKVKVMIETGCDGEFDDLINSLPTHSEKSVFNGMVSLWPDETKTIHEDISTIEHAVSRIEELYTRYEPEEIHTIMKGEIKCFNVQSKSS